MDNYEEELWDEDYDDNDNIKPIRNRLMVISNHQDNIYVHTNTRQLKDIEIEELKLEKDEKSNKEATQAIIDISQITKGLNSAKIRHILFQNLIPDINISKESSNRVENLNKTNTCNEINLEENIDSSYGLDSRNKFEKLSKEQKLYLKELMIQTDLPTIQIQSKYNVSYSALNKIKGSSWSKIKNSRCRKLIKLNNDEKDVLIKLIKEYILKTRTTVTAKEITNHINLVQQKSYSTKYIRSFMKDQVRLSFKRVKPRPLSIDFERLNLIRSLFAVKFSKLITRETLIINIDESSINRHTKDQYSWGFKGKHIEAKNTCIRGSVSMIKAICSNGSWIDFVIDKTIDSETFNWFLKIMDSWLKSNNLFEYTRALIILDNCSIHKSNSTKSLFRKMKYLVFYIPPYSPNFAPVEMCFSIIKKSLYRMCKSNSDMLTLRGNYAKIHDALLNVKSKSVKGMFRVCYKNIKQYLRVEI